MLKSFLDIISRNFRRSLRNGESGQALVLGVGLFVLALAALMITADIGYWSGDKRDAQNDADAIALAAAPELPDTDLAIVAGEDWAVNNNIDPASQMTPPPCPDGALQGNFCFIDMNGDDEPDKVRVQVSRPSKNWLGGAFGLPVPTIDPTAAAGRQYAVGACIMPWGIIAGNTDPLDHYGLDPTALRVFQDTNSNAPGNYGAVAIYGNGNDTYVDLIHGVCEPENNSCAIDAVLQEGEILEDCRAKTGRMGATTANALDDFYGPTDGGSPGPCDAQTYDEAVAKVQTSLCLPRAVPLAIINAFPPQGSSTDIAVYGIANFYLAGWDKQGNGDDSDGVPVDGYVWGYLMESMPANPAWDIEWGNSNNPFAPIVITLVE